MTLTKYQRNPFGRKACIAHYGLSCLVCDFNFEQEYGEIGKNFIHVHHLTQVAKFGINSCDVDPPFLHVDPPGKRAIIVRA